MRGLSMVVLLFLATGCGGTDPAKLKVLEADRRAAEVQLDILRRAGESDLRLRDLRRKALERSKRLDASAFEGDGAFLIIRQAWFEQVMEAVLPIKVKVGGFGWRFKDPIVELTPDGVRLEMTLQVVNNRIKKRLGRAAAGTITGVLIPERDPEAGGLRLVWRPLEARLDDKDFRVSSMVFKNVAVAAFDGMVPPLPIPLGPADRIDCCGKTVQMDVQLSADDAVVLREGLLLPFTIRVDTVSIATPAETTPPGE
jgi:hypothetical protein